MKLTTRSRIRRLTARGILVPIGAAMAVAALTAWAPIASGYLLIQPFNAWIGPDVPVEWHWNSAEDDPTITNEHDIIRGSFLTWAEHVAGVNLGFAEGVPVTSGGGLIQDGQNIISMNDPRGQCTGGCLAVTSTVLWAGGDGFWTPGTDSLLLARGESDITFNASTNWEDFHDWPPCPALGFDLWGVATHEMGHFIGIDHAQYGSSTMFYAVAPCDSTRASLAPDDKRATRILYRDLTRVAAATLHAGNASLTVTNKGSVAFTGAGGKIGDSFVWGGTGTNENVFECSFALGVVGGEVSNNFRTDALYADGGDADFQQTSDLMVVSPGGITQEQAVAEFDDSRAESSYGVDVVSRFFADDAEANEDFVIAEYQMINNGLASLTNLRGGFFVDVDFNGVYATNSVHYDAVNDLAYVSDPNTTALFGVAVLNSEGAAAMRALYATDTSTEEEYSDANKEAWFSGGFERTTLGPADIALLIATGDFNLARGDTAFAAFAFLGGNDLADLQTNAQTAKNLYLTQIQGSTTDVTDGRPVIPIASLEANQPNPFHSSTRLDYTLFSQGRVQIDVLDTSGRLVRTLLDRSETKGRHTVRWDGTDAHGRRLPSGVYFTRMRTEDGQQTKKMHLLR